MKIGVLGGSFNPPTFAHIELSKQCITQGLCDEVIWVPVNNAYQKDTNIPANQRVDMVELAIKDEPDITCSLHELEFDRIVRTLESMQILQKICPNGTLYFIAGADKLKLKWMQKEPFISNFGYILLNRGDIDCERIIDGSFVLKKYKDHISILDYTSDISSTLVRDEIKHNGYSDRIPRPVMDYIQKHHLFQ